MLFGNGRIRGDKGTVLLSPVPKGQRTVPCLLSLVFWISADAFVSTGQGFTGNNMFVYCGNNPVNRVDYGGESWLVAGLLLLTTFLLGGCGNTLANQPNATFNSADEAAMAFAANTYPASYYTGYEYISTIYSVTMDDEIKFGYTEPKVYEPHYSYPDEDSPFGTSYVAYAHTHPNINGFSSSDIDLANSKRINAYVIGPDHQLLHYDYITGSSNPVKGVISLVSLTSAQKMVLVNQFQKRWDAHAAKCSFCNGIPWPRN